jgi:hypothetical protein
MSFRKLALTAIVLGGLLFLLLPGAASADTPHDPFDCPEGWTRVDPQTLNWALGCLPDTIVTPGLPPYDRVAPSDPPPLVWAVNGEIIPICDDDLPGIWEEVEPGVINPVIKCLPTAFQSGVPVRP